MKVYNERENLVFDDSDPRCHYYISNAHGQSFAFVQCLDIGWPEIRLSIPEIKRYWGLWDWDDEEGSIRRILKNGGKWPDLPSVERFEKYQRLEYQE